MIYVDYDLPENGLGTDFSQFERPISFAEVYTNRFRNITGGAERRPGQSYWAPSISGSPNLTRGHEWVSNQGAEVILASDDFGNIWRFDASASAWAVSRTGGASVRYISAQVEDKLILVNGVDRNIYTNDGGVTWSELKAYITRGVTAGGTNTTTLIDSDISNWIGATLVANNDIVYNVTRNGYGIVSTVASASLTHTAIGTAGNGAGLTASNQTSGDQYQLIDYVDLNIIPQGNGSNDNIAQTTTGTTTTVIAVSGVNFANTEIRRGDFVYNTTRSAIALVGSVSANINLQNTITGQIVGDSLAFFKSAMPIASWVHVHYGRAYYLDSRNQRNVVISAPDDPEDLTTYQKTLDATSISWGTQQPTGDTILTMGTFQSYFVAGGKRNIYIYNGNTPILDTSSTELDFTPVATYPDGAFSRFSLITNGANLIYATDDGLQAISIGNISNTTIQNNVSTPIKEALTDIITQTSEDEVQVTFYPTRSWVILKVGSQCFILNNTPTYNDAGALQVNPAWHLFTGPWAQMNHYFVRRNGDLLGFGSGGNVYYLDNGDLTDVNASIPTQLTTAWYTLEEPRKSVRVKQLSYIKPVFESGAGVSYTITANAGWDNYSSDTIIVSAGGGGQIGNAIIGQTAIGDGTFAQAQKSVLRARGEQIRLQFVTNSSAGPDIITGHTLYGSIIGAR